MLRTAGVTRSGGVACTAPDEVWADPVQPWETRTTAAWTVGYDFRSDQGVPRIDEFIVSFLNQTKKDWKLEMIVLF
jgi:hypothetical protein